jgi:hypothetical protein
LAGSAIGGGGANLTSSNSIYVGYNTKPSLNGNTNEIVIGYDSTGIGSNTTSIGNSSTISTYIAGNLLLGSTISTGQRLQVTGDTFLKGTGATSATSALLVQNSAATELVRFRNDGSSVFTNATGNNFTREDAAIVIQRNVSGSPVVGIGITSDNILRFKGESAGFNFLSGSSQLFIQAFTITGFSNTGVTLSSSLTNTSALNNTSASAFNNVNIINTIHSYNNFTLSSTINSAVANGLLAD